jgi:hypothetical protein
VSEMRSEMEWSEEPSSRLSRAGLHVPPWRPPTTPLCSPRSHPPHIPSRHSRAAACHTTDANPHAAMSFNRSQGEVFFAAPAGGSASGRVRDDGLYTPTSCETFSGEVPARASPVPV